MSCVGCSFTVEELDSKLLVSRDFTFDLVANATPATDLSMQELGACSVTVSGNMYCLQFAEISVTYHSNPRLMTTQDFDPSPFTESISTSVSSILQWDFRIVDGPENGTCRAVDSRQVDVILFPSSNNAGRVTKNGLTSTDFVKPASRET